MAEVTELDIKSIFNEVNADRDELIYLREIVSKINSHEKVSIDPSYRDAYDKPRKRITEENYDPHYRNKDVYSNKRVGQYNELVKVEEAEQTQFDVDQVSAWFNFTSELATRVYEDDWDDFILMRSQGRLLHYYIVHKFDRVLTAEVLGIEVNSLNHNLRRLFKKLDSYPLLRNIFPNN